MSDGDYFQIDDINEDANSAESMSNLPSKLQIIIYIGFLIALTIVTVIIILLTHLVIIKEYKNKKGK